MQTLRFVFYLSLIFVRICDKLTYIHVTINRSLALFFWPDGVSHLLAGESSSWMHFFPKNVLSLQDNVSNPSPGLLFFTAVVFLWASSLQPLLSGPHLEASRL